MKKFKLIKEALRIAKSKSDGRATAFILYLDGSGCITYYPEDAYKNPPVFEFLSQDDMIEKLSAYVKTNGFDEHPK